MDVPAWLWTFYTTGQEPAEGQPGRSECFGALFVEDEGRALWARWGPALQARWAGEHPGRRHPKGWVV